MNTENHLKQIPEYSNFVDSALRTLCSNPPEAIPRRLWDAMTYSLTAGGKRIRPVLCLLGGEACGADLNDILPMAIACEMIHTASLIHDDLPSMDDDSLRRGKPANHIVFGEPLALLAGDALFLWAFDYARRKLMEMNVFPSHCIFDALGELLEASGPFGICGGQVLDSDVQSFLPEDEHPWRVAATKTAVLIRSSVMCGVILAGASETSRDAFSDFGYHLGMAFQIIDDIMDVTGDRSKIGKTPGKDRAQGKITFVTAFGLDRAREFAVRETNMALESLECIEGDTATLRSFPEILRKRSS